MPFDFGQDHYHDAKKAKLVLFRFPHFFGMTWRQRSNYGQKQMYLTFDDGPNPKFTPKILDILKTYGARDTFFPRWLKVRTALGSRFTNIIGWSFDRQP